MAFGQLPPWLNVSPNTFLAALESGAQVGATLAQIEQRGKEAAADNALRSTQLAQNRDLALAGMANDLAIKQASEEEKRRQFAAGLAQDQAALAQREAYQTGREDRLRDQQEAKALEAAGKLEHSYAETARKAAADVSRDVRAGERIAAEIESNNGRAGARATDMRFRDLQAQKRAIEQQLDGLDDARRNYRIDAKAAIEAQGLLLNRNSELQQQIDGLISGVAAPENPATGTLPPAAAEKKVFEFDPTTRQLK